MTSKYSKYILIIERCMKNKFFYNINIPWTHMLVVFGFKILTYKTKALIS